MAVAGDGPKALAVMYSLTFVVLLFTALRIYTRIAVVQSYGLDDHVYVFAFILLLLYTVFIHIAATHGFGQNMWDVMPQSDISAAVLNCCIAQTFAVIGMAVAKWSLGLFLLRLVKERWHTVAIWVVLANLMTASLVCLFFFWFQCEPAAFLWNKSIGGKCELPQLAVSIYLGASCVFTDLFFAIFPWVFMWRLQMKKREKLIILASMSLGIIAAACGIKRATEIPNLMSSNYLRDSVGIIVWSSAEQAVTMICIGIPVCRPLYKGYLDRWTSHKTSSRYENLNGPQLNAGQVPLHTIGGSDLPGGSKASCSKGSSKGDSHTEQYEGEIFDSDSGMWKAESNGVSEEDVPAGGAYVQRPASALRGIRVFKEVSVSKTERH